VNISKFFKNQKDSKLLEKESPEYASICGIIEAVEFNRTKKEISGVLFDLEGREFEFNATLKGNLLKLTGVKEDLPLAWHICADYLKNKYAKNEIEVELNKLRGEINESMQQLQFAIEELSEEVAKIEIPEVITQAQPVQVMEEKIIEAPQEIEEPFEEDENQLKFEDFSDEDLASHALKVLNGEVAMNG
jgi:hypothetical protein